MMAPGSSEKDGSAKGGNERAVARTLSPRLWWEGIFQITLASSLVVSTLLFAVWTLRWPLVGDASLIHYIVFLIEHGRAPYRDLGDMNMPGSFLIEMAAMEIFGGGAVGWRLFDFTLLAAAGGGFAVLTRRAGWLAACFAAALFALVHGRDGLAQGGQRDLTMAVLLLLSTAALSLACARQSARWTAGFALLAGVALTIKPTALPLSLAQGAVALYALRKGSPAASLWRHGIAAATILAGPLAALGFLLHEHAVRAFWAGLHEVVPYYASLGHRPLSYLLNHSISPLLPLLLIWFAVLALGRPRLDLDRLLLLIGVAFGLLSYVVQARGLPYYRYPLLAFLLPLLAIDFTSSYPLLMRADRPSRRVAGALAGVALVFGSLLLAPQSAIMIHSYRWWQTDAIATLEAALNRLGGAKLSGHIQCIDSISGCGTALYDLRLVQQTGILSDFLLFGPARVPVVAETRRSFAAHVFADPPEVIVISSWLHIDGPGDYRKLQRWPELETFLAEHYRLETDWHPRRTERWWSREELPAGFRIYVRRSSGAGPALPSSS